MKRCLMHSVAVSRVRRDAKCSMFTLRADGLSWKTTRRFQCMLRSRAFAANADAPEDAPKHVGKTDLGGSMFLRLPASRDQKTPSEEKHHEGE